MVEINIYPKVKEYENFIKLFPIKKANKFLPEWYKEQKLGSDALGWMNAKNCPAIQDYVSTGFIIPLWGNLKFDIYENEEDNSLRQEWSFSATEVGKGFKIEDWIGYQGSNQSDGMEYGKSLDGKTLKLHSPYIFDVPDGYSIYFTDPFYHFRQDIRCLSGIVEVDKFGEVAFPFEILKRNFYIAAGTPLIHCYVFKKEDNNIIVTNNNYNKDISDLHQLRRDDLHTSRNGYKNLKY